MRPSRILVFAALLIVLGLCPFAAATAEPVEIEINKGDIVRLPRAAATVFVADPSVADVQLKSPTLIYVFGKGIGETTLIATDADEGVLLDTTLRVSHNLSRLRETLGQLVPDRTLSVSSVGGSIVIEGIVATPQEAAEASRVAANAAGGSDNVINRLTVTAPTQVNLRVRIAEMSRAVTKSLGIDLTAAATFGDFGLVLANRNPFAAVATGAVGARLQTGSLDVNGIIDALEEDQLVRILAEPNLTALSGETASFLAGGEFPIAAEGDEDSVTIIFKQFGVSLAFTPTVLSDGRINLNVRPEVSELSSVGAINVNRYSVPALTTRRAETTVELASGQSFAIAGLLREDADQSLTRFPGLGDVPVLGALFRSSLFQRNETELVIIVTPYIVTPVSERQLATPVDGLRAPHDIERILFGAQWRHANPRGPGDAGGIVGPVGFELR